MAPSSSCATYAITAAALALALLLLTSTSGRADAGPSPPLVPELSGGGTQHSPRTRAAPLDFVRGPAAPSDVAEIPAVRRRRYPPDVLPAHKRCAWDSGAYLLPPDVNNSTASRHVLTFLQYLEQEVLGKLGYLYTLRDGNLLGAVRHGGMIPGDADLDAVMLLPLDETLESARAALDRNLRRLGQPFTLLVNDDGRSRWFAFLRRAADGTDFHADVTVYPSSLFAPAPLRNKRGELVFPTKVQRAFHALCRCTYRPLGANCFEHAPTYLRDIYGDYTKPGGKHAYENLLEEVYI